MSGFRPRFRDVVLFLVLLLPILGLQKKLPSHDVGMFEDDAYYVLLARNLIHGHYAYPSPSGLTSEIHFLPGFSALLAPVASLAAPPWNHLRAVSYLMAALAAILCAFLLRVWLPSAYAISALLLSLFNFFALVSADRLFSEWWLLCLALIALSIVSGMETGEPCSWKTGVLITTLVWAALVRPEGIFLTAAVFIAIAGRTQRPWRLAWVFGVPPTLAVSAWLGRNWLVSGRLSTYTGLWRPPSLHHLWAVLLAPARFLLNIPQNSTGILNSLLIGFISLLIFVGLGKELFQNSPLWRRAAAIYLLLFMGVRWMWPVEDDRFFLAVLPLLSCFLLAGLPEWDTKSPTYRRTLGGLLVIGLTAFLARQAFTLVRVQPGPFDRRPKQTLNFIDHRFPAGARFFTNKPGLLLLTTNKLSIEDTDTATPDELAYELQKREAKAVWIQRQPIADQVIFRRWRQRDLWFQTWTSAFSVLQNADRERSTVFGITLDPHFVDAYEMYLKARGAYQTEGLEQARRRMGETVARYPFLPCAWNDLAAWELESGHVEAAKKDLQKALHLRPVYPLAQLNLARAYKMSGKNADVNHWLNEAEKAALKLEELPTLLLIQEERAAEQRQG